MFLRDGRELRMYGSQGEQRLALLALLLAERAVLADAGALPLILLDDVMSELDVQRREFSPHELSRAGQSMIASTDLAHVPGASMGAGRVGSGRCVRAGLEMGPGITRLRIAPGAVLQEALAA